MGPASMMELQFKIQSGNQVEALVNDFYKKHDSPHKARPTDIFFLAMAQERLVGTVRYCVEENTPLLRSMRVDTEFHGQGIGRQLLKNFESYLEERKIRNTYCLPYGHLDKFYRIIEFQTVEWQDTPSFLKERLLTYRQTGKQYLCMRRP